MDTICPSNGNIQKHLSGTCNKACIPDLILFIAVWQVYIGWPKIAIYKG